MHDLGKQVPIATVIEKAVEVGADAIGLSALLVSTSKQMPYCVDELARRNLLFPVIIGGAAINRRFGYRAHPLQDGTPYAGGVFYAKDAFEGLEIVEALVDDVTFVPTWAGRPEGTGQLRKEAPCLGHKAAGTPRRRINSNLRGHEPSVK